MAICYLAPPFPASLSCPFHRLRTLHVANPPSLTIPQAMPASVSLQLENASQQGCILQTATSSCPSCLVCPPWNPHCALHPSRSQDAFCG